MPRLLLALLLALSVGAKLGFGGTPTDDEAFAAAEKNLTAFLVRQGFHLGEIYNQPDLPLHSATQGDCRLLVAVVSPFGMHRDILRQLASPADRVRFVVDGMVYDDQPKWRTWTEYYWQRLNRALGRRRLEWPVLGVIAPPGCNLQAIAWRDLARLP